MAPPLASTTCPLMPPVVSLCARSSGCTLSPAITTRNPIASRNARTMISHHILTMINTTVLYDVGAIFRGVKLTISKEDYLKAVAEAAEDHDESDQAVSSAVLRRRLGVSAPA